MKEALLKSVHIVWIHLYEVLQKEKLTSGKKSEQLLSLEVGWEVDQEEVLRELSAVVRLYTQDFDIFLYLLF